jgi:serine/threonine protein kinase
MPNQSMFDYAHKPLPSGYVLDVYRFERVLGSPGAFGITYVARERNGDRRVAIKELFPSDFVVRRGRDQVEVQAESLSEMFIEAKRMFQQEAEILSQVKHQNVVKVLDYFEANGTGYMVMSSTPKVCLKGRTPIFMPWASSPLSPFLQTNGFRMLLIVSRRTPSCRFTNV